MNPNVRTYETNDGISNLDLRGCSRSARLESGKGCPILARNQTFGSNQATPLPASKQHQKNKSGPKPILHVTSPGISSCDTL